MNKIGILYICTGKYSVLWDEFYNSCEKNFLINFEKSYFVFTDSKFNEFKNKPNIKIIFQKNLNWPFTTLYRYKTFIKIEKELSVFDYLFFFNADAEIVKNITPDMILPRIKQKETLVVVQHAGFYNKKNYDFTYDRNPRCKAFIPYGRGRYYVTGAINGGVAKDFLVMSKALAKIIDIDIRKGIIALWHDESYLNKYILNYKYYRILSPSFVYPTQNWWKIPYKPYIQLRDKTKYFDVRKIKTYDSFDQSLWMAKVINKIMKRLSYFRIYRAIMNIGVKKNNVG